MKVALRHSNILQVRQYELELKSKDATEFELRQHNCSLLSRNEDLEKSISMIQPKYQEALNDRGEFEHSNKEITDRENRLRKNYESRDTELSKVCVDKAALEAELSAARELLATSSVPEIADFEKLRADIQIQRAENERLQKRISSMQNEVEYMRSQYQGASNSAADLANELTDLKAENAILTRKASDNARQIHEIQASSEIAQHLERITELEDQLAERDREVEKKNEELKSLLNGRRATRGTSVPRSPRMGTMSPNVSSRRVLNASVGSRGNSPAPGDGLPQRGTFGEALFGEKLGGSGRWGNHLREV